MQTLRTLLLSILFLLPAWTMAATDSVKAECPEVKLQVEQLPDLNIPRAGHQLFYVNGELTVAGGHTDGFVPTPTAEYLKDGEWHLMDMVYNHDFGFSVVLNDGKVLLGGGCEQPIGIGQTFLAELYNPTTHTFNGFCSMERKRTLPSALELDSGQVVISGNWHHDDGIEVFDGEKRFTYIKDVVCQLSAPHIFRISKDDALMVGFCSTKGDTLYSVVADRIKDDTVHIPLLESWLPMTVQSHRDAESFIGDASKDEYIYLMPIRNKNGQVSIAKVENGEFSLLPTDSPIPMQCQGNDIDYYGHIVVDRKAGRAYLMGGHANYIRTSPEKKSPLYLLCIDYAKVLSGQPAPLTLYYTDPLPVVPDYPPVVTDEGDLVIAGGLTGMSNFTPSRAAYLLHLGPKGAATSQNGCLWLWVLLPAIILIGLLLGFLILKRRGNHGDRSLDAGSQPDHGPVPVIPVMRDSANDELLNRIRQLMEQQQLYLNSDLKLEDVASALGLNRSYVSDCINSHTGDSFSQFVNGYRIEYVKRVLRSQPDTKVTSLYLSAGFSSEQSFYRNFKSFTGMTPKEWIASQKD